MGVNHYENFPVASWLCPPALRPAVAAIYWFARTADDLADEGDAPAEQRLDDLLQYGHDLEAAMIAGTASRRWPEVFGPLAVAHHHHRFPVQLLRDLLSAFSQDVRNPPYADRPALLDYCRRSANPVGRLLLHLYGVVHPSDLGRADAICTSLQLINFWQDLGEDLRRGRNYLPASDLAEHQLHTLSVQDPGQQGSRSALLLSLCAWARGLMEQGLPLALRLPGRAGWELRLVVQGGLRILDKIQHLNHDTLNHRPTVGRSDLPLLLWRAMRMSSLRTT